jgi:hypothetical protein
MKYINRLCRLIFILGCFVCCTKFIQIPPPTTALVGVSVYSTNSTAAAALNGIYLTMANNSVGGGSHGLSALLGLSADEFNLYPGTADGILNQAYANALQSVDDVSFWRDLYNGIYNANSAIEGITSSSGVTSSMKQQLTGEAKFIRAFCNFYLVNIYGDVPLVTTTNYKTNASIARTPLAEVYHQIIADLKDAQNLLSENYLNPDGSVSQERVRPNKGTATALLARAYLYQQKWDSAEVEATSVINNTNYSLLTDLDSVFLTNSSEAIWQLETPDNGGNTPDAGVFLLSFYGGPSINIPFLLSDSLVIHFEQGDLRATHWVDSIIVAPNTYYFPFKYKLALTGLPPAEFPTLFRLSEQYLIRAEARVEQNNLSGAATDLNAIRTRAGLPNTAASSHADLLTAILNERRFELFTESGHRWLDLKRTGNVDAVMSMITPLKGGVWNTTNQLYPIPRTDIISNGKLTQNPGYQ